VKKACLLWSFEERKKGKEERRRGKERKKGRKVSILL